MKLRINVPIIVTWALQAEYHMRGRGSEHESMWTTMTFMQVRVESGFLVKAVSKTWYSIVGLTWWLFESFIMNFINFHKILLNFTSLRFCPTVRSITPYINIVAMMDPTMGRAPTKVKFEDTCWKWMKSMNSLDHYNIGSTVG